MGLCFLDVRIVIITWESSVLFGKAISRSANRVKFGDGCVVCNALCRLPTLHKSYFYFALGKTGEACNGRGHLGDNDKCVCDSEWPAEGQFGWAGPECSMRKSPLNLL